MSSTNIEFENRSGHLLQAKLELPDIVPVAYALFAHCFTCSKDILAAREIGRGLADHGVAVLRFDFTGLGASEGEFAETSFSSNLDDLEDAARYMERELDAPQLLIGHSLGGTAMLKVANRIPAARALVTIGSPFSPAHAESLFGENLAAICESGESVVTLGGRPFRVKKELVDDLSSHDMHESVSSLGRALLVLHSPTDQNVAVENAGKIFQVAKHPKSFVSLDNADHLLTKRKDARYAAQVIANWAARYLQEPESTAETPHAQVHVRGAKSGFETQLRLGRHFILADEPRQVGGKDLGPTPYDLLVGALGACTAMTLRMYADRKGIALERVEVELEHDKVHATECEMSDGAVTTKVDRIVRKIRLYGELDENDNLRLLKIADKCPVHRSLNSVVRIETALDSSLAVL